MEPVDYQKILDEEIAALIGAGADVKPYTDEEPKSVLECCGKVFQECRCSSTSSKENANVFTGTTYTLEEFAVSKHAMQLVSKRNILSVFLIEIAYENVAVEYTRFIKFIRKYPEPGRSQLATIIFPLTIHLYLILMQAEDIGLDGARLFLSIHSNVLRHAEGYRDALDALRDFTDVEEIKKDSRFNHFVDRKKIIKLSKDVFKSLQDFLISIKEELGQCILLSVLYFNIDFVDCDLCSCPNDDNESNEEKPSDAPSVPVFQLPPTKEKATKGKKRSRSAKLQTYLSDSPRSVEREFEGEGNKNEADVKTEKELEHTESDLENIEISRVIIYSQKAEHSIVTYDFGTDEVVVMHDIDEYTEPPKKPKSVPKSILKPVRLNVRKNPTRNVRFMDSINQKLKQMEVDSEPKEEEKPKAEPNSSSRSLHSVDFNCSYGEVAYAIGDAFIYTLAIARPKKEQKNTIKLGNNRTVVMRTLEHDESHLKSTIDPENENVYVVKYLPGEPFKLLAACGLKVRLFNTKTSSFLAEYITDNSFIYSIDVDSTCQWFATANHYSSAYIYTFSYAHRICMLNGHEKAVTVVKFHPNGIYVATGSEDCTVRMFEVDSGQCVRVFVGHLFGVWAIDFSCDGSLIASADSSGLVNAWDIKDGVVISKMAMRVREEIHSVINSLCFHENNFVLAACNEKGEVQFWDAKNPANKHIVRCLKKPVIIKRQKGNCWYIAYLSNYQRESVKLKK